VTIPGIRCGGAQGEHDLIVLEFEQVTGKATKRLRSLEKYIYWFLFHLFIMFEKLVQMLTLCREAAEVLAK